MPIQQNISDLEKLILQQSGYVEKDVPRDFVKLVGDIQQQLKLGNFKNRTGNLRRSMKVKLINDDISISMLFYGYFLSFGVYNSRGNTPRTTYGITAEVANAFGEPDGYVFGTRPKGGGSYGVDARQFYPTDIEEQIINILEKTAE
jgi:hypothetical protein